MKNTLFGLALGLVAAGALVGCSHTAEGAAQDSQQAANDTANAGQAVAQGAANAANEAANVADNTGKAVAQGAANAANAAANTVDNAGKAAAQAGAAAVNAADNAGKVAAKGAADAANAASHAGEAAANSMVTGKVKLAIAADDQLHGNGNTINVDTLIGGKVVLRGSVTSAELKKKAQTIAEKVIKDNNYKETVVNQLEVGGSKK